MFEEEVEESSVVVYKKKQRLQQALWLVYQQGVCTLSQLAKGVHTSVPSVTELVEQLVQENWIQTVGTVTGNNGRRPTAYSLNPDFHRVVVLDINTHGLSLLVIDTRHEVVFKHEAPVPLENSESYLETLKSFVMETFAIIPFPEGTVMAIGIAMPGLIDEQTGKNLTYPKLNITGVSFKEWIKHQFSLPVFLINDTKATVLGESRFGRGQGSKHMFSLNIDWGVGLGIVLNGEVFRGASGFAGELGHIQVEAEGQRCYCGKIGCLDTITSAPAVVRRIQKLMKQNESYTEQEVAALTIDRVLELARSKDPLVSQVIYDTGFQLGKGLATAITILNPEIIIIDGILAQAGALITKPIEEAIEMYCMRAFLDKIRVEVTTLDGNAKWMGTHAYVMENILNLL
ncbi:sugar kinase [Siphonobacter sp. BAB-5385]|uniref:ROK family transcriptional regulator n=1 Tax=Siphonobacter sp. BAB-5385 TaxID=1864822 RepID=UPI000B9E889F|nr:ROK family transcriptional regulator [Siphonobacter sp. BAB-5385]OZI07876.1 sugar kinase [Siphonobacter sp. BAB-5385]